MPRPELAIVGLVYVAALVLGQRMSALIFPSAQEIGFAVAAIAGSVTAVMLYQRRARERAPTRVKLSTGLLMAVLAVIVGFCTYILWRSTLRPMISLPIAAVATLAAPFLIFPLLRRFRSETSIAGPATPIGEMHVVSTAVGAIVVLIVAYFIPVPGRSDIRLVAKHYPSLSIGLPAWEAEQDVAMMEFGSIKLKDPRNPRERFLALRWIDSDPVQADEYVQTIAVGGLIVRDRWPAFVNKHQGTTFYLESDDHLNRAAATVWNCPQDHRVLWIFSYLSGPKSAMLATHERILRNLLCHTGRNKNVTAATTQQTFPRFTPPPGFTRPDNAPAGAGLVYVGPDEQEIVFDAALPGRSDVLNEHVSPEMISKLLTQWGFLQRVEGAPTLTTVPDLQGHTRRVWSVAGVTPSRSAVQLELMTWYCDKRNLTFIGRYATPRRHDAKIGIDALLPASCHSE